MGKKVTCRHFPCEVKELKKVGRNDPCPCGSGKKYKKCHGASNVVQLSPEPYNIELDLLHEKLIAFAVQDYQEELAFVFDQYPQPEFLEDEELLDYYLSGLTAWAILCEPVHNNQTIFDIFYKKEQNKIKHERVRQTFKSWSKALPGIYIVISETDEWLRIQNIRTMEEYRLKVGEENNFTEGSMLIGVLIPYVGRHEFLFSTFEITNEDPTLIGELEELAVKEFKDNYPTILGEVLFKLSQEEIVWDNPLHEMVAVLFTQHMNQKEASEELIASGIILWKYYAEKVDPIFRKPQGYAAALEYVMQREVLKIALQSQNELADEYGTNPTTISTYAKRIIDEVGVELEEVVSPMFADEEDESLPLNASLSMEKDMRDIQQAITERGVETEEELRQFLAELNENQDLLSSHQPTSPRDLAQDKLYEAYESTGWKRKRLIHEALAIYPNSPDAYLLMAEDAKTAHEEFQIYHQAVIAGEQDLGVEFFRENRGHFWMMTETRPYMRAKENLARIQYKMGARDDAIANYEELLELNPNDNQGIRYTLLTAYLDIEQYDKAKELMDRFNEENTASFQFNQVLIHYFNEGISSKTKSLLKQAESHNPYVKDYLTQKKPIRYVPDYMGIGDEREAIVYVYENAHLWEKASELVAEWEKW
jgi:tetratricopeptide (TPR) repeat protein